MNAVNAVTEYEGFPPMVVATLKNAWAASQSENTRRNYACALRGWARWCDLNKQEALPATVESVCLFLSDRVHQGAKPPTLRLALSAIRDAHRWNNLDSPTDAPEVKRAMKGFIRQAALDGVRAGQAKALTVEAVAAIRGHLNGSVRSDRRAARDMAAVSLSAVTGLRIGELAALDWSDIASEPDGTGRIAVHRSKTDQEGAGETIAVTGAAMGDLANWERLQGAGRQGKVFGITARQIGERVKAVAAAAGLGDGYSGHSGRVGLAVTMTRLGAPVQAVQRQGRWKSSRMVASYTRSESAGEVLKWLPQ